MKLIATKKKIENDDFKVTIGTTNKKRPVTFYMEFNGTASLVDKDVINGGLMKELSLVIKKISNSIVNEYSLQELTRIFNEYGEEKETIFKKSKKKFFRKVRYC